MKKTGLLWLSIFCTHLLSAQVAVSYYPFQSILSIATNTEKRVWADLKVETNTFASNLNMEFSGKWNYKQTDWVNYYFGPGVSFNPLYATADLSVLNGYFLDIGVRIKPLQSYKNCQLVFDISPYVNRYFSNGNLRTRLGIAFNFLKSKK